jgi:ribose transport system permease protein
MSVESVDVSGEAVRSVPRRFSPKSLLLSFLSSTATWILVVDVLLVVVFGAFSINHSFWSIAAMQVVGLDSATALVLACGIALLLGAGEIDLSVGAGLLLASVYGGKVIIDLAGSGTLIAALAGLGVCIGVGAVIGLFNGLVVTRLRVTSLIATLATLGIATGVANIATGGTDLTGVPQALQNDVGIRQVASIPLPALFALIVWAGMWFLMRATRFGLRMLAFGSSRSAAERSGIRVDAHLVAAFAIVGALAGFAGFIDLSRFATTNLAGHQTDALAAITACVIGGTSLFGGRVSIGGVLTGTLLAVILQDGLIVIGLSSYYQLIAIGAVLIAAVFLDSHRNSGGSLLGFLRTSSPEEGA